MLSRGSKLINLNNQLVLKRFLATKPFYYQELFEHAKPLNIPYKKLTSKYTKNFLIFYLFIIL